MDRIISSILILFLLFLTFPAVALPTPAIGIEEDDGLEIPNKILADFEDNYVDIWFDTKNMTAKKTSEISYSEPYSMKITYTKLPYEERWNQSFGFELPSSLRDFSNYSAISIRVYGTCSINAYLGTSDSEGCVPIGLRSSMESDKWNQLIWDLTATDVNLSNVTGMAFLIEDEIGVNRTFFLDDIELTIAAIYVPDDYPTIQDAVNAASDGDTIIVRDGTYTENVKVYKRLTIQSENCAENCIVQAANSSDYVFEVLENYVNISGLTVEGANGTSGIYLGGVSHCNISNNKASNNHFGIYLYNSSNNSLASNIAYANDDTGIILSSSRNNILTKNIIYNNRWNGICLYNSSNNSLASNIAYDTNNGIILDESSSNTLTHNTAYNNGDTGIILVYSSSNMLINNTVDNNTHNGIWLDNSSDNTLTCNIANSNNWGIVLYTSCDNALKDNTMSGNGYNFGVSGWLFSHFIQDIDTSNEVNGKPIYYWVDQKDKQIPNDAGYVGIVNSTNITVKDLRLTNNGQGVLFAYTSNSKIENVTASENYYGIYVEGSSSNTLSKNSANNNWIFGILLQYSSDNVIVNNCVSNNRESGIHLSNSNYNLIYHNNLIDNGNQAYDNTGTNLWNNNYPTGGNYWSDYTGSDSYCGPDQNVLGSDGICDSPYDISGDADAQDRYPFMNRYGWLKNLTAISVSPSTKTLYVGETHQFMATAKDQNGDPMAGIIINWTSSNTAVGTVSPAFATTDSDGKATTSFTASTAGTTTIKAKSGNISGTASVTVQKPYVPPSRGGSGGGGVPRDSDGDGVFDIVEKIKGTDPYDPCDPNPECAACKALMPTTPAPTTTPVVSPTPKPTVKPTPVPTPTPPFSKEPNLWDSLKDFIISHWQYMVAIAAIVAIVVIGLSWKQLLKLALIGVLISTFFSWLIPLLRSDYEWVWILLLIILPALSFIAGVSKKASSPNPILIPVAFITLVLVVSISEIRNYLIARLVITILDISWSIITYNYSSWFWNLITGRNDSGGGGSGESG